MGSEEGDQLESVQLAERSRLQHHLDNKKKRPVYTGYDDEEFSITIGHKPSILAHYDEVIDGVKSKVSAARLDASASASNRFVMYRRRH